MTGDPDKGRSAQAIAQSIRAGVRAKGKEGRGAIVVAHANGRGWHTAEALPLFIPQLQAEGYRFVTVSELLAAGRPVSAKECYEVRPGDNVRYDRLFGRGTGGEPMVPLAPPAVPCPGPGPGRRPWPRPWRGWTPG